MKKQFQFNFGFNSMNVDLAKQIRMFCLTLILITSLSGCANYVDLDNLSNAQLERARRIVGRSAVPLMGPGFEGLKEVSIGFPLKEELEPFGVTKQELEEQCSLKLRLAGLKVIDVTESVGRPNSLLINQDLRGLTHADDIVTSFTISSDVSSGALLERENYTYHRWVTIWRTEPV